MKFDKDNYEPTSHDCVRLIAEGETFERHDDKEEEEEEPKIKKKNIVKPTSKSL